MLRARPDGSSYMRSFLDMPSGAVTTMFRRIIGYSDLAKLALAVERDVAASRSSTTVPATAEPTATLVTA